MQIRKCRIDELPKVMAFIDDEWAKDHVLSWHKGLMEFQHRDPADPERYNWLIASEGDELAAILGYIPTRVYDQDLGERSVIWLALWKLNERISNSGLGIKMLRALEKIEPNVAIGVLGINGDHPPMYRALGYQTGELNQYVFFADGVDPQIAIVPDHFVPSANMPGTAALKPLSVDHLSQAFEGLSSGGRADSLPCKGATYFKHRYCDHPIYQYELFQVSIAGEARGVIATRSAKHQGAEVVRIVDAYCDPSCFKEMGPALRSLLLEKGAEYADIWQYGVPEENLSSAGFVKVLPAGDLIVPNFFEPFVARNGRIEFAMKVPDGASFVLFRGDGDQDRPNAIDRKGLSR